MEEQVNRADAEDHRQRCQAKLLVLKEQRSDLGNSLNQLWEDLLRKKTMKIYRRIKCIMTLLNPVLYRRFKRRQVLFWKLLVIFDSSPVFAYPCLY